MPYMVFMESSIQIMQVKDIP